LVAGFVLLLTNLPASQWSAQQIAQLYRLRWQVELYFKRTKSILQLDHLRAELSRDIHLLQSRIDEQADTDAAGLKPFYRDFELLSLRHKIETAFGRNFLPFFWHETHLVRHDAERHVNNLFGVAHFEIQFGHDVCPEPFDVAILDVAAIRPQMGDDSAGASPLAKTRRHKRIRFGIFRFRHCGITRLTQRRHVIDVDSQSQTTHLIAANRTQTGSLSKSEFGVPPLGGFTLGAA